MQTQVMEYKCPCCNAGLSFGGDTQQLTCAYCDNTFDIGTVKAFNEAHAEAEETPVQWEKTTQHWSQEEQQVLRSFQCPACGGEIITDDTDAAAFCPYCDNPTIFPSRLSGNVKPEGILPFKTTKEDAKAAYLKLCKGKPLLPKLFTAQQRIERISGMYVPFWLYECDARYEGSYKATRLKTWSDSQYTYTRTDHYLLSRQAVASFHGIPMDGSKQMDDALMESIEPYDYSQVVDFHMAYLSGYLADKYDVESKAGEDRVRQRVDQSIVDALQPSLLGYATAVPTSRQLNISHSKAKYVLLPVWILNTRYKDKIYTFAMNGQTGKITGSFPICPKRTAGWFAGVCAGVTALAYALQFLLV